MRVAAIDIGTVTCRLLVGELRDGRVHPLARRHAITNLGIGVDRTGRLDPDAIERVVSCIASHVDVVRALEGSDGSPIPIVALATSASRDASNAAELVDRLSALGVELSVIEGSREAALSFKGASCAYAGEDLLVVDVGGGSTELIWGVGGQEPVLRHSFDIGCRRVTERYFHSDPPTPEQVESACAFVRSSMAPLFDRAREQGLSIGRMVAVAGTATSCVSMEKSMDVYDSARVDGSAVTRDSLAALSTRLDALPLAQRRQVVGLEPDRAPVINAGLHILSTVMDGAGVSSFTVSESDILQGIIMDACASRA